MRRITLLIAYVFLPIAAVASAGYEEWHLRNAGVTANTLNGVAYGNGSFVAVGASGTILVSSNGLEWTARVAPVSENLTTVTFGAGQFFAGGRRVPSSILRIR